jgi:hypothetical protein
VAHRYTMSVSISPSARGLKNVNIDESDRQFAFIIGSNRQECPYFLAEFISSRVSNLRRIDPTINEISISVDYECFSSFLKSVESGESHSISEVDRSKYLDIFCQLQNAELCEFVKMELSIETVIDLIEINCRIECDSSTELEFIASHFHEFEDPFSKLKSLDISMIEKIVRSQQLHVKSEDSLYDFICAGLKNNPDFFNLFEHIRFDYLSTAKICDFCEMVCDFFDRFNISIFKNLRKRLIIPIDPLTSGWHCEKGIIRFLTTKCCGNVHDKSEIVIEFSSMHPSSEWQNWKSVVDLDGKDYHSVFHSDNRPNSWLSYDFKSKRVYPTKYYIRSRNYNAHHMRSWVLEGSNNRDNDKWIELDRRDNIGELSRANGEVTFPISHGDWFRWIRVRQTGKTCSNNDYLVISAFEIFGFIYDRRISE